MATAAAYDRRTAFQPTQRIPQVPLTVIALARGEEGFRLGPGEQELRNLGRRVDHEPVACFHWLNRAMWGVLDPYLTPAAAAAIAADFPHRTVKPVEAGHWLMIDAPADVAQLLLAGA